ncbi:transcriptional regulator, LacI family [Rhizobiales bacterium GAS191]|jgi:LacI family transcriptional regulator|nr:transcriptional regulator, LacI family [Rhizobiales bacterium GAS113]SED33631.1 transcriptional regulator, LacI family [Rhizobiales bacterium GAS188]SEE96188.1 transcriptional regulator, LacI family [Rhizobiales bacterium GAS191]
MTEAKSMSERRSQKAGAVTIKEVAALARVHSSTVSRALNPQTRSKITKEVASRVIAAANALKYRPDRSAASLRTGRSRLVGVLVPDIANLVFAPILSGITERLSAEGYATLVADAGNELASQIELVDGLIAHRVDGLILATASRDDAVVARCLERDIPIVLVNRAEAQSRVSAVVSDDGRGMQLAVDHLVGLGHRLIGHIGGPEGLSTGYLRRRGFEAAVANHQIRPSQAPVETASAYTREAGAEAARRLLDRHKGLTAIVAANDLLALGAYDVLHERGLRCPADMSVVGHNDMPLMDLVSPALTTVRIGHRDMGREAADLLVQRMLRGDLPTRNVMLAPKLILRASTAPPQVVGAPRPTRRKPAHKPA